MGRIPPWADLPQELLSAIASCLNANPIDILRFRVVCKSWYSSSLPLPASLLSPLLPLRLPRPPYSLRGRYSDSLPKFSVLSATAVYALRPPANSVEVQVEGSMSTPKTWLLFVDQLDPGEVRVRQPLTRWPFSLPLDFPRKLNLLDFHVSEIGRYYNLSYGDTSRCGKLVVPYSWSGEVVKVVFLSNGSAVSALSEDGKLGLLRLGAEKKVMDSEWEIMHDGRGFRFDDIVEYKGRLLGIDRRGRVYDMGHHFSGMNVIVPPIAGGGGRRKRLIESSGILHLVVRCDVCGQREEMGKVKVYKLNEKTRRWTEVTSIGDGIFCFGTGFSFSTSAQEFEDLCGKNCIMYEERSFKKYGGYDGDSWLFYRLGRSTLNVGVYHLEDGARIRALEAYPCYFGILWPPPTWIWPSTKERILGTLEVTIDRLLMGIHDENLKAKYKELSSLVGTLFFSCDSVGQQEMLNIMEEVDILKKFTTQIDLEIEKESNSIEKELIVVATSRRTERDSTQLSNQIATSSNGAHDRHECVHYQQKATQNSAGRDSWLSKEVKRRLSMHIELSGMLRVVINFLEKLANLKDILKSRQEESLFSISTNGKTTLLESM